MLRLGARGAIVGALSLGFAQWISDRIGARDPARALSDALALGPSARGALAAFVLAAIMGALACVALGHATRGARTGVSVIFACVLCPAAVLCVDLWVLRGALPFAPSIAAALVFGACVIDHARGPQAPEPRI